MKTYLSLVRGALWLPIVVLSALLFAAITQAAKAGGSTSTPSGLIYYQSASVSLPGSSSQMFSMRADGSQKTALGINTGLPSVLTHGGKRWFLRNQAIVGQTNLSGGQRYEAFAVREDGLASVQLTNDPAMGIFLNWTPNETVNGAVVAGLARRWNADGTVDPASIGVYAATLRFDAAGNVMGLDGPPAFLVSNGGSEFSFSSDMTRLVEDSSSGLRIVDVATGVGTVVVADSAREYVHSPAWSPNGSKIVFSVYDRYVQGVGRLDTVSPDGTGRATVVKTRSGYFGSARWSPDSSSVAFIIQNQSFFTTEMYRASVVGAPNTFNLNAPNAGPAGWR